jgi:uncharacterized radical SAM superfamily protein
MKKTALWIAALVFVSGVATAQQQEFEKQLKYFNKITISPKIHLVLTQGEEESIKLTYSNIDAAQINVVVDGDKLKVYLDDARIVDKRNAVMNMVNTASTTMLRLPRMLRFVICACWKSGAIRM